MHFSFGPILFFLKLLLTLRTALGQIESFSFIKHPDRFNDDFHTSETVQDAISYLKLLKPINPRKDSKRYSSSSKVNDYLFPRDKRQDFDDHDDYESSYRKFVQDYFGDPENESVEDSDTKQISDYAGESNDDNYYEGDDNSYDDASEHNSGLNVKDDYEYDDDDNEQLSEQEVLENTESGCIVEFKYGEKCLICHNAKNNENSESCTYTSESPPNKFSFKKHKQFKNKYPSSKQLQYKNKNPASKLHTRSNGKRYSPNKKYANTRAAASELDPKISPTATHANANKALKIFHSKDWSKCEKNLKKDGIVCYICNIDVDTIEEQCMYVTSLDKKQLDDTTKTSNQNPNSSNQNPNKSKKNIFKRMVTSYSFVENREHVEPIEKTLQWFYSNVFLNKK